MEGAADRSLPQEARSKRPSTKIIAIAVVAIVIIAGVAVAVLLTGGGAGTATAVFTADKDAIKVGDTVNFTASGSTTTQGSITEYTWNFGDNEKTTTSDPTVSHKYNIPGNVIVGLSVKTDKGATANATVVRINVAQPTITPANDSAPVASFISSVESTGSTVAPSTSVTFNASASYAYTWNGTAFVLNGSAVGTYAWVFGDGTTGTGVEVSHQWTTEGIYGVILTVARADNTSITAKYIQSIMVKAASTGAIARADTFIEATIGEPDTLDPAVDYETSGGEILQNVYETLVWYDGDSASDLIPMLATNVPSIADGTISPDGLNYTYHIRPDVKFHSGATMTPEDVEYSLERVLTINDPNGPAWMMAVVMIPGYSSHWSPIGNETAIANSVTVSGNDVIVHLVTPYPAFNYIMAYTVASVVEKAVVEAHGGVVAGEQNDWMKSNECGTGPYKLVEWVSNQYIRMDRFDSYWRDPAAIAHVFIKKVNDIGTREMLLFSGDADMAYIDRQHTPDVRGRTGLSIAEGYPTFNIDFIGMNENITASDLNIGDIPLTFFSDVHVRMAFAYAFDYDAFIADTLLGTSEQPNGVIPNGMAFYNASIPKYAYDLNMAADELALAMDTRTPSTTDSYLDNGFTINLYYNSGNLVRQAECDFLKEGLESLGSNIHVIVGQLEWSPTYLHALYDNELPLFTLGWAPDYADPDDYTSPFYITGSTYGGPLGLSNSTLSDLVIDSASELNETIRAQMYADISMSNYENAYYIFTSQATSFHVERDWVSGYYFNPMYSGQYFYSLSKG